MVPLVFLAMHDRPQGESGEWQLAMDSNMGVGATWGLEQHGGWSNMGVGATWGLEQHGG